MAGYVFKVGAVHAVFIIYLSLVKGRGHCYHTSNCVGDSEMFTMEVTGQPDCCSNGSMAYTLTGEESCYVCKIVTTTAEVTTEPITSETTTSLPVTSSLKTVTTATEVFQSSGRETDKSLEDDLEGNGATGTSGCGGTCIVGVVVAGIMVSAITVGIVAAALVYFLRK